MTHNASLFQNLKLKKHRLESLMCSGGSVMESDEAVFSLGSSEFDLTSQHSSSGEEDSGYGSTRVRRRKRVRGQHAHKGDTKATQSVKEVKQKYDPKKIAKQLPQYGFAHYGFPPDMLNGQDASQPDCKAENRKGRASIGFIPVLTQMVPQFTDGAGDATVTEPQVNEQTAVNTDGMKPIILTQFLPTFIMTAKGPVPVISSCGSGGIPQIPLLNMNNSEQKNMKQFVQMATPEQLSAMQVSQGHRKSQGETNASYNQQEQPKPPAVQDYSFIEHYTNGNFVYKGILKKGDCVSSETDVVPMATVSQACHDDEQEEQLVCAICNDRSTGLHYGIITCEGCKGFFKRTVQNKRVYNCVVSGNCEINKLQRNRCQFCRFKKCLQMGMVLAAVREDRMPGGRNSGAVYNLYKVKYKKHKKKDQMVKLFKEKVAQFKVDGTDGKIETEMITERKRMSVPFRVSFDKRGMPQIVPKEHRTYTNPAATFCANTDVSTFQQTMWESDIDRTCVSQESVMSQNTSHTPASYSTDSNSHRHVPFFQSTSHGINEEGQCYVPAESLEHRPSLTNDQLYANDSASDREHGGLCQRNIHHDEPSFVPQRPTLTKSSRANHQLISFPPKKEEDVPRSDCRLLSRDTSCTTQDNIGTGRSEPDYNGETKRYLSVPKCVKESRNPNLNQTPTDYVLRVNDINRLIKTRTPCENANTAYPSSSNDNILTDGTNEISFLLPRTYRRDGKDENSCSQTRTYRRDGKDENSCSQTRTYRRDGKDENSCSQTRTYRRDGKDENSCSQTRDNTYQRDWSEDGTSYMCDESEYKLRTVATQPCDRQQKYSSERKSPDSWFTKEHTEHHRDYREISATENVVQKSENIPTTEYVLEQDSSKTLTRDSSECRVVYTTIDDFTEGQYTATPVIQQDFQQKCNSHGYQSETQIQNSVHSLEKNTQNYKPNEYLSENLMHESYRERRYSHEYVAPSSIQNQPPQDTRTPCYLQTRPSSDTLKTKDFNERQYNFAQNYLQDQCSLQPNVKRSRDQRMPDQGTHGCGQDQHNSEMITARQPVIAADSDMEVKPSLHRVDIRVSASGETMEGWPSRYEKLGEGREYQTESMRNIDRQTPVSYRVERQLNKTEASGHSSMDQSRELLINQNIFHGDNDSYNVLETKDSHVERDRFKYEYCQHTNETVKITKSRMTDGDQMPVTCHRTQRNLQEDHLRVNEATSNKIINELGLCEQYKHKQFALPPPDNELCRPEVHRQLIQELVNCNTFLDISGSCNSDQSNWIQSDLTNNLCRLADEIVGKLVAWTRHLPFYSEIPLNAHSRMLTNRWHELLVLITTAHRALTLQEHNCQTEMTYNILLNLNMQKLESYLSRMYKEPVNLDKLKVQDVMERLTRIMFTFLQMRIGIQEFVSLQIILLLYHNESVDYANIKSIQDRYTTALEWYVKTTFPQEPNRLGELLVRLPEIRTTSMLLLKSKMIYIPFLLNS